MPTITLTNADLPTVGAPAPDFTLLSTGGQQVTLSGLRGKPVLLAFFPLAFTSTCTSELCDMRDEYDAFAREGVEILPISVDSVPTLQEFKRQQGFRTELLSDFKREVTTRYGILHPDRFFSQRAYFLIDRDGVLRWSHVEENPSLRRENAELLAQIAQLKN